MSQETDADIQTLQAELKQVRAELAKLTATLGDLGRHGTADALSTAQASLEAIVSGAKKQADGISEDIEKRPVAAALTAFGIGTILGLLLSGRRS